MSKSIGIHLGATNSCMAVIEGGEVTIIDNAHGHPLTPSMVALLEGGERLVGVAAKRQQLLRPEHTISGISRLMGARAARAARAAHGLGYSVVAGAGGEALVDIRGTLYEPTEISAMILERLKADAEAYLGQAVDGAIVTVPARADEAHRSAVKAAARRCGLRVIALLDEPQAAALGYGVDEAGSTVLIVNLGGASLEATVLEIGSRDFDVKARAGDEFLGTVTFDAEIVDWLAAGFGRRHGADLIRDKMARQVLFLEAEKARNDLSVEPSYEFNRPFIWADESGPRHLEAELSREEFRELTSQVTDRVAARVGEALDDAERNGVDAVDHVLLVGDRAALWPIREAIGRLTPAVPVQDELSDVVFACGAAVATQSEVKTIRGVRPYAVFISYRREDEGFAGRLRQDLAAQIGEDRVFMDRDIAPGERFDTAIEHAVGSCETFIAVIGPGWTARRDELADPTDWVRMELQAALKLGLQLIPVLVGDERVPDPAELPDSVRDLALRQAHSVKIERWQEDVVQLASAVGRIGQWEVAP